MKQEAKIRQSHFFKTGDTITSFNETMKTTLKFIVLNHSTANGISLKFEDVNYKRARLLLTEKSYPKEYKGWIKVGL